MPFRAVSPAPCVPDNVIKRCPSRSGMTEGGGGDGGSGGRVFDFWEKLSIFIS